MSPDFINGLFEFLGSVFIWRSIWLLNRQKQVHGVSILSIGFFMSWGYWNLYYYPNLNQWLSFAGGLSIVTANTIWVSQIGYYLWRNNRP